MTHESFTCTSKGYSGDGTLAVDGGGEVLTVSMMHHGSANVIKPGDVIDLVKSGNIRRQRRITAHINGTGNVGTYRVAYVNAN